MKQEPCELARSLTERLQAQQLAGGRAPKETPGSHSLQPLSRLPRQVT